MVASWQKVQKYGPVTAGRPSGGQERSQKSSLTFQVSAVASEDWKLVPGAWLLSCKQRRGMVFWKTLVLHSASQSIGLSEVWSCHLCNSTGTRISRIRLPPVSLVFLPQYPAKLRGNEESAQVKQLSRWNLWIKLPQKIAVSCNVARLPTCYYYGIFSLGSVGWAVNGGFYLDQVTSSFMAIWDSGRSFSILWHILQYLYKWMFPSHLQFNALPSQVFKMGSLTRSMCGDDPTTYEDMVSNHGVLRNKQPSFQEDLQLCWTHYLWQHSGAKPSLGKTILENGSNFKQPR